MKLWSTELWALIREHGEEAKDCLEKVLDDGPRSQRTYTLEHAAQLIWRAALVSRQLDKLDQEEAAKDEQGRVGT